MLARIETIEQLQSAVEWMKAGQSALQVGLMFTLILLGLNVLSIVLKDERLTHAARRGQYAMFGLTAFCAGLLYLGIFDGYYFVSYIGHVTENNETVPFKISALWASQQGSLLFWCLILTSFCGAFAFSQRHNRTDRRLPYILAVLAVIQFFFFYIMVNPFDLEAANRSSPFSLSWFWMLDPTAAKMAMQAAVDPANGFKAPSDGWNLIRAFVGADAGDWTMARAHAAITTDAASLPQGVQAALLDGVTDGGGMNPALHNYWIAIHPPMLYCGFVGFTIPFAYAVGSLLSGEVSEGWLKPIRLWTMGAWGFLTIGIALGGLWAYEILGWGGYWAWDPVENASFVPWLTGTAFIHSVIVTERRGMLRFWSFMLIIITYCMTVVGTFLVRSGVINSVHAFGATGDVDTWFYGFIAVVFMGSLLALIWRAPLLKSDRKLDSVISREGSFLFNNLILLAIALATLLITIWPLITEKLFGKEGIVEFGQNAFVMFNIPLFLLLLLLMGIGPALAWRRNNGRQLMRAFVPPTIAAVIVGVMNFAWLSSRDLFIAGGGDAPYADGVRYIAQVVLWPICAFTLVCIFMEFVGGARARKRSTGENIATAMLRVTLGNRRRYGGYIVHLGILLVALGIYYSSLYENEGSVTTQPGGFSILGDKLSGDRYLVVFEDDERTANWNFLRDKFGLDEERAQLYSNMLRYVRLNPDLDANQIVDKVKADTAAQMGGELPDFFVQNALPKMIVAVQWGVSQRGNTNVYESYNSTLRIFPYSAPADLDTAAYIDAHGQLHGLLYGDPRTDGTFDGRAMGLTVARLFAGGALESEHGFRDQMVMSRAQIKEATAEQLLALPLLDRLGFQPDDSNVEVLRNATLQQIDEMLAALDALAIEGIKLGAELPEVNAQLQDHITALPKPEFARLFNIDASNAEAYAEGRFSALDGLERFHKLVQTATAQRRTELVMELASRIGDADAQEKLLALRPLSLTGLQRALKQSDGETATAIETEIDEILVDATTVRPRMRIFYDKRTGAPRMSEPVKDPYYYRTPGKDMYFILQDAQPDGTATFRFFVKPYMSLGLLGLAIIALGTVMAFLPQFRRRRPEVA